jgi:hypothetical protein
MALSGIISGFTNLVTSFISWLISVVPPPLRVLLFLFFIIFLAGGMIGFGMGFFYSCDSIGDAYKMSSITLSAQEELIQYGVENCYGNHTGVSVAYTFFGGITGLGAKLYNWVSGSSDVCDRLINSTVLTTNYRDSIIRQAPKVVEEQGFAVGCVADSDSTSSWYYPSLKWYSIDIFDKRIWLLASIITLLAPLAFWWYHIVLKR